LSYELEDDAGVEEGVVPLDEVPADELGVEAVLAAPFPVPAVDGFVSVVPDLSSALGLLSPPSVEVGGFSLSE